MENTLPSEVISHILYILFEELRIPQPGTDLLIPAYSIPLVSRQMYALYQWCLKSLSIDWTLVMQKMLYPSEGHVSLTKILRTHLYYGALLSLLQEKIALFYPERKKKGYVAVKAVKHLTLRPSGLIKEYRGTRKKARLLYIELITLRLAMRRRKDL